MFNPSMLSASTIMGSHGFMTSHKWRDTIGAFINVEASGTGGLACLSGEHESIHKENSSMHERLQLSKMSTMSLICFGRFSIIFPWKIR
ncbi:uncharacterized protein LOC114303514 isoform X2 [Camellia sinensis]|uniref:uncharacterized protein LOC114303514 isoform X2 n=1 Tax=Camellia sinensis TaxID=4442 RepID=UPI0010355E33|nr:uncharacterized protein LOC114303514 isoform X2 [Camellia sinensis]XP_028104453.1 uncharacterized protein LOC114303514 isoform X2 [Camellia sinensis]XP_028104454.1 uncharacterized protein LOC114303514 isoform X2 [Camellia sinensis]XP_028104455.1 uncharacterized protein LOC114303514 isoform X2 [Camellia sinensis]